MNKIPHSIAYILISARTQTRQKEPRWICCKRRFMIKFMQRYILDLGKHLNLHLRIHQMYNWSSNPLWRWWEPKKFIVLSWVWHFRIEKRKRGKRMFLDMYCEEDFFINHYEMSLHSHENRTILHTIMNSFPFNGIWKVLCKIKNLKQMKLVLGRIWKREWDQCCDWANNWQPWKR